MKKEMIFPAFMLLLILFTASMVVISGCGSNATGGGSSGGASITATGEVYITDVTNKWVVVLSTSGESFISVATIELTGATSPKWMAMNPSGTKLYVADEGANKVYVINTIGNTIEATVTVCNTPRGMAFNADASRLFVATPGSGDIDIIDTSSDTKNGTLYCNGEGFSNIAYDELYNEIYIADTGLNSVEAVSAEAGSSINGFAHVIAPYDITVRQSTGTQCAYTTSYNSAKPFLSKVNMNAKLVEATWESTDSINSGFHGLVISSDNKKIYAADHDFSYIDVLDLTTGLTQEPINYNAGAADYVSGTEPEQIALYSNDKFAAVLNTYNTSEVVLLDLGQHKRIGSYVLPSSTYFGIAYKP